MMLQTASVLLAVASLQSSASVQPLQPPAIRGHIYQLDGRPASNVEVSAFELGRAHTGSTPGGYTDRNGAYLIRLQAFGAYQVSTYGHAGAFPAQADLKTATVYVEYGKSAEVNLQLSISFARSGEGGAVVMGPLAALKGGAVPQDKDEHTPK